MSTGAAGTILGHIRRVIEAEAVKGLTDAELLRRYVAERDESAFAAILGRHGRLVWRVCRLASPREEDAEDAFQATFLVLARRPGAVRKAGSVGSWLYGVAHRLAVRAGQRARKRQARERLAAAREPAEACGDLAWREVQSVLDEEVRRLPEKYRTPFVLCLLEGRTREDAAWEIGCAEGTVSSRIARARRTLQRRLARRGVSLSAVVCALAVREEVAGATVPEALSAATIRSARDAARPAPAVRALADAALAAGPPGRRLAAALLLALGLLSTGVGLSFIGAPAPPGPQAADPPPVDVPAAAPAGPELAAESLPPGALARLGTLRQRAPGSDLAVTADGKEVVALGPDVAVRRFDVRTGELRATIQLPRARAYGVWLSPGGTHAVLAGSDGFEGGLLEHWDLRTGQRLRTLTLGKHYWPTWVAFSANGSRAAVADGFSSYTQRVLVWDLRSSEFREIWSEKKQFTSTFFAPWVALSPDGKRLVACHLDQILRCWDADSGQLRWQSEKKSYSHFALFSPDGRVVLAPSDGFLDAETGRVLRRKRPPPECAAPVAFSPDGRYLAYQTLDEGTLLWEPGPATVALRLPRPAHRREGDRFTPWGQPRNVAFTADSAAVIRSFGSLQRWDLATDKPAYPDAEAAGHTGEVTRLVFSPDGRLLASGSRDQTARVWDVRSRRTLHAFARYCDYLAFTPDGRHVVAAAASSGKSVFEVRDAGSGRSTGNFGLADRKQFSLTSGCKEMRYSPDGGKLLVLSWKDGRTGDECVLTVWDAASGACLRHERVPWGQDSVLTPDGTGVVALESRSGVVRWLDVATGAVRQRFEPPAPPERGEWARDCDLAVSPDGRFVAARCVYFKSAELRTRTEPLRLGNLATGRSYPALSLEGPALFGFSPDSSLLAVAGQDAVRLWETATWKEVGSIKLPAELSAPTDRPRASTFAFSPDGRTLATGHPDSTILLWDATLRGGARGGPLTAARAEALWADLDGADAGRAHAATWALADDPQRSVSLFRERLKPVEPPSKETLEGLLANLDSEQFTTREAAERKLRDLGDRAEAPLRTALARPLPAECKRRVESVLASLDPSAPLTGEALRAARAVLTLQRAGTPEARQVLERLAGGAESARLTRAARDAVWRMGKP
jgi:RNA polymerase sigma factor (sigma-70 family)